MTRDAFDRLRDADPLRGASVPDADSAQAHAMREAILASTATDLDVARRRRRRRVAVAAAVAAAAAAAAVAVSTSRVSDPTSIGCYDAPTTEASTAVLQSTGASPVAQCRELWEQGQIDATVTSPEQVPDLVACVLDTSGHVGVFPASSCDDVHTPGSTGVGGPAPDPTGTAATPSPDGTPGDDATGGLDAPDYHTDDRVVIEALEDVRSTLLETCMSIDEATVVVEETLAEHGLEDWTVGPVVEGPYDPHCASFFPQVPERTVSLVPDAPAEGQGPASP